MIVIVDERDLVKQGFCSQFANEGFSTAGFDSDEFEGWVASASESDLTAVDACLVDDSILEANEPEQIRMKVGAPIIALVDQPSLEKTLTLFKSGVDDVIKKPCHVQEILARIAASKRRVEAKESSVSHGPLQIFFDGRDPEINSSTFPLPRRERRILEYLASIGDRRANKAQIFNAIYGVFNEDVEENVIESHISKLRKKLRNALGYDPIDSKRYLGYRLMPAEKDAHQKTFEAGLIGVPA